MRWRPPSNRGRRALGAAASVAATGALIALLVHRPLLPDHMGRTAGRLRLLLVPISPESRPGPASKRHGRGPAERRTRLSTQQPVPQPAPVPTATAALVQDPIAHERVEAPPVPASGPLRLDAATLRAAVADSQGNVRRLAQRSGQTLDDARATEGERLGVGIAASAKGDCVASNAGGSLLSLPFIAYSAIAGKCK